MMKETLTKDNISILQNQKKISTSSAFSQNCLRPILKAPIHLYSHERDNVKKLIQLDALDYNPLHDYTSKTHVPIVQQNKSSFYYRSLTERDLNQCRQLHIEWFPLLYQDDFYLAISRYEVFSLAAVYRPVHANEDKECILGIILASQLWESHLKLSDLEYLLHKEDIKKIMLTEKSVKHDDTFHINNEIPAVYILSLGVAQTFEGLSIGGTLLSRTLAFFQSKTSTIKVFYLHVASYNKKALKFYEKHHFKYITLLHNHYFINGCFEDGFLFAYFPSQTNSSSVPSLYLRQPSLASNFFQRFYFALCCL
ncbi:uncharacterized protein LOC128883744 isoform X2 [Hylaeus volcanicus]|uniref:uncharacterized protein LOC128883744 isoform X2 n=1 Tax=Hylaeus volcanicus TaxID=313075 RepID=UPI0023B7F9B0|nr:uncharacterized protein LOC128883744 isoform X2 [Hylaeus volcanicus]